jgi:hypothetical protein
VREVARATGLTHAAVLEFVSRGVFDGISINSKVVITEASLNAYLEEMHRQLQGSKVAIPLDENGDDDGDRAGKAGVK